MPRARRSQSLGAVAAQSSRVLYGAERLDPSAGDAYWYRVLRPTETPLSLREPDAALSQMGRPALRQAILRAVTTGNKEASNMFHVTGSVKAAIRLWAERRHLYQVCLVRFPKHAVPVAHTFAFTVAGQGHDMLDEHEDDPPDVQSAVMWARSYAVKDQEAALLSRPTGGVEFYDGVREEWQAAARSQVNAAQGQAAVEDVDPPCGAEPAVAGDHAEGHGATEKWGPPPCQRPRRRPGSRGGRRPPVRR